MLHAFVVASTLVGALVVGSGTPPLTLDDFLSFPQRPFLVGATVHGKDRIAWMERRRGAVNVWAADENDDWLPRQLTNQTEDSAQDDFSFFRFTADGSAVVFVASPNAETNAQHLTTPATASTFVVPFVNGHVRKLGDFSALELAATSTGTLFTTVGGGQDVSMSLFEKSLQLDTEPRHLFSVKQGKLGDFAWHPQGHALAFTNDRGDHAFVGLYVPGQKAIKWVAASVDSDVRPAWSPDGQHLAWIRAMVPPGNVGYSPFDGNMGNRGPDFAVMSARIQILDSGSVKVSESRELFQDVMYGMPTFGFGIRPLVWVNNSMLLFGTEALSGWTHAVTVAADRIGRPKAREVRAGNCEDSDWVLADDWIYLASNCQEIDALGIERIHAASGKREVVVPSANFTVAGVASSHRAFAVLKNNIAYLQSNDQEPYTVFVKRSYDQSTQEAHAVTPPNAATARTNGAFVKPRVVTFPSSDGRFMLHGQLFLPRSANASAQHLPGVVYTHGGSERQSYPAFHYDTIYASHYAINQWLQYQGFAVLSINYRSGTGYGHGFRVCDRCMARGAEEYTDVREAALQLAKLPEVDGSQIGIWGLSYGGLNALQACARDSSIFKACVSVSGMFSWISTSRYFTDTGLHVIDYDVQPSLPGGWRALGVGPEPAWDDLQWQEGVRKRQLVAFESSPAGHVANWTSPTLLIHGDADEEVDFQEAVGCVRKFRALGRQHIEVKVFPDENHGCGATYAHMVEHIQATGDFLSHHIGVGRFPVSHLERIV